MDEDRSMMLFWKNECCLEGLDVAIPTVSQQKGTIKGIVREQASNY